MWQCAGRYSTKVLAAPPTQPWQRACKKQAGAIIQRTSRPDAQEALRRPTIPKHLAPPSNMLSPSGLPPTRTPIAVQLTGTNLFGWPLFQPLRVASIGYSRRGTSTMSSVFPSLPHREEMRPPSGRPDIHNVVAQEFRRQLD